MSGYIPLNQEPEERHGQTAPRLSENEGCRANNKRACWWFDIRVSPCVVYLFLTVIVLVNLGCCLKTSWTVRTVFEQMHERGEVLTDTRNFPRANIYDGLLVQ